MVELSDKGQCSPDIKEQDSTAHVSSSSQGMNASVNQNAADIPEIPSSQQQSLSQPRKGIFCCCGQRSVKVTPRRKGAFSQYSV